MLVATMLVYVETFLFLTPSFVLTHANIRRAARFTLCADLSKVTRTAQTVAHLFLNTAVFYPYLHSSNVDVPHVGHHFGTAKSG